jgi:hypothetical protein
MQNHEPEPLFVSTDRQRCTRQEAWLMSWFAREVRAVIKSGAKKSRNQ